MFGSIAKVKLKLGSFEKMFDLTKSNIEERPVKGRVFNAVFRSQSDPDELWSVVGFEDEAAYPRQCEQPSDLGSGRAVYRGGTWFESTAAHS
jgi:hypothetical protein